MIKTSFKTQNSFSFNSCHKKTFNILLLWFRKKNYFTIRCLKQIRFIQNLKPTKRRIVCLGDQNKQLLFFLFFIIQAKK